MTTPISPEPDQVSAAEPAPAAGSWRDERRAARHARRGNTADNWIWGGLLIVVGVFLLLKNLNLVGFDLHNWWALFILIPAIGSLATAVSQYRQAGRWTAKVTGSVISAGVIALVALTFLLDWNWAKIWPLFLILGGLATLVGGLGKRNDDVEDKEE